MDMQRLIHVAQLPLLLLLLLFSCIRVRRAGDDEAELSARSLDITSEACMRKARRLGEAELTAAQLSN